MYLQFIIDLHMYEHQHSFFAMVDTLTPRRAAHYLHVQLDAEEAATGISPGRYPLLGTKFVSGKGYRWMQ